MQDDLTEAGVTFLNAWQQNYPETPPITYHFKRHLTPRWVRIYSLPEAQRYPNNQADLDILLARQNAVIDHLVPQGQPIQFVFNWLGRDMQLFQSVQLTRLGVFHDVAAETSYDSWLLNDGWEKDKFNSWLTMIADEQMRGFILATDCIISPYDGGMDIILKDVPTAQAFKRHFPGWISPREDGL
jgi:hypothetical protein